VPLVVFIVFLDLILDYLGYLPIVILVRRLSYVDYILELAYSYSVLDSDYSL
jgi:hypothetical protein